jgi:hypothetical protein
MEAGNQQGDGAIDNCMQTTGRRTAVCRRPSIQAWQQWQFATSMLELMFNHRLGCSLGCMNTHTQPQITSNTCDDLTLLSFQEQ